MWIGFNYKDIEVGDEFIVTEQRRYGQSQFSKRKVTRVTDNFFWLDDGKRYSRSYGYQHGTDSRISAKRFDLDEWNDLVESQQKLEAKQSSEERKKELEELSAREDFGCAHITDDGAQEILRGLRLHIGLAKKRTAQTLEAASKSTTASPWPLFHNLRDEDDWANFRQAINQADIFIDLHHQLVELFDGFDEGVEFKFELRGREIMMSKDRGTDPKDLLLAKLRTVLMRFICEFLEARRPEPGQRGIIETLMNITDDKWSTFGYRFSEVKES
jgi:hypothetical protein